MPKKRVGNNITPAKRKTKPVSSFNFEDAEFLTQVDALAFAGFYDVEIADKLQIDRFEFSRAKGKFEKFAQALENARVRARACENDMPSPARFAEVWEKCGRKRSKLMKEFGIGFSKLQSWLAREPAFIDIMAMSELEFLEQLDTVSRVLALGGVKGKDKFEGWSRYPAEWMIRFHLNTTGRRYGYGEQPILPDTDNGDIPRNVEQGIDIEEWINKEMEQSKNEEGDDNLS